MGFWIIETAQERRRLETFLGNELRFRVRVENELSARSRRSHEGRPARDG